VSFLIAALTLLLLAIVMLVLSAPLRAGRRQPEISSADLDELRAAREAKYREIRDAELDYRTGKLSQADFEAIDSALRAEALDILDRLRRVEEGEEEETKEEEEGAESGPGPL
jgi:type II secretory pathway component PulM